MANERSLIVEDNEKSRRLVRDVLRFKGYETVETETAEEGLRIAREARPDLILMDIQLPGGSTASRRSARSGTIRAPLRFPRLP